MLAGLTKMQNDNFYETMWHRMLRLRGKIVEQRI